MTQNSEIVLSIDLGTQSTRVALINVQGDVKVIWQSPEQSLHIAHTGWAEQNPEMWWRNVKDGIEYCLAQSYKASDIAAIGISGQMHGCVAIGQSGELLLEMVQLWCDKRYADKAASINESLDSALLQSTAANQAIANWHGLKISWLQHFQPELYEQTWKFLTPKDFLNYKLSGNTATDFSEASGSFLMDAESRQWSPRLANALNVDLETLPQIQSSVDIMGEVSKSAAQETGLKEGTPIVTGGGDMLCMLLAAGLTRKGIASDITGTSSIFSVFTEKPVSDYRIMNLHHVLDGWVPFGLLDSGGISLRWFRDKFCQAEIEKASNQKEDSYVYLSSLAEDSAPDSGLLFLPHLMGERTLGSPHSKGVFFGLGPQHGVPELTRAVMSGVSFDLKRVLVQVENEGLPVETIFHSGGGARSPLWSQIKADIYQKPVETFVNNEGGLLGAAILAATGVGLFSNEAEGAEQCLQIADRYEPNFELRDFYAKQFESYVRIHDLLQGEFDFLSQA